MMTLSKKLLKALRHNPANKKTVVLREQIDGNFCSFFDL